MDCQPNQVSFMVYYEQDQHWLYLIESQPKFTLSTFLILIIWDLKYAQPIIRKWVAKWTCWVWFLSLRKILTTRPFTRSDHTNIFFLASKSRYHQKTTKSFSRKEDRVRDTLLTFQTMHMIMFTILQLMFVWPDKN